MKNTVIVCGMPRSATRMVANILNVDSRILITDEFPHGLTSKLQTLISGMNGFVSRRDYKDDLLWSVERVSMVHNVWLANTLNKTKIPSDVVWIGNKTPSNELYFDFFEEAFNANHPYYIYCVRSPKKVLSSLKNMPWNKETEQENWERWKESVKTFIDMEKKCPERVLDVSFDNPDGSIEKIGRQIFGLLGLDVSDERVSVWDKMLPAQPARKVVARPLEKISQEAEIVIDQDPFYIEILERWPFLN